MINLNIQTLIIHLAFFLVMVVIINQLLLKPLLSVMDKRKQSVDGNRKAAAQAGAESEEMQSKYESEIERAKKDAAQEKEKIKKLAEEEEQKVIIAARENAGDLVAQIREKIAAEYKQARDQLQADSEAMGKDIAARILGRSV